MGSETRIWSWSGVEVEIEVDPDAVKEAPAPADSRTWTCEIQENWESRIQKKKIVSVSLTPGPGSISSPS